MGREEWLHVEGTWIMTLFVNSKSAQCIRKVLSLIILTVQLIIPTGAHQSNNYQVMKRCDVEIEKALDLLALTQLTNHPNKETINTRLSLLLLHLLHPHHLLQSWDPFQAVETTNMVMRVSSKYR